MAYKVGPPKNKENFVEKPEFPSSSSLLNISGNSGNSGNSVADVLRIFPGARILTEAEAKALRDGEPAGIPDPESLTPKPQGPRQLKLIVGGKK